MDACSSCLSCLGLGRRSQQGGDRQDTETSRLLYDDPDRNQYGSNHQSVQRVIEQPDPEHLRREREEMESICHQMSDQVIDVFTVAPQEGDQTQSQEQAKALLIKHGMNPADFSDSKLDTLAQQSLAGQQESIETFQQSQSHDERDEETSEVRPVDESLRVPTFKAGAAIHQATAEEAAYKMVSKKDKEAISIELGRNETAAAKAAMG